MSSSRRRLQNMTTLPSVCCRSLCEEPSSELPAPSSHSGECASGTWSSGTGDGGSRKTSCGTDGKKTKKKTESVSVRSHVRAAVDRGRWTASDENSHWSVDDQRHHHIHVGDVFLQIWIRQVHLCTSVKRQLQRCNSRLETWFIYLLFCWWLTALHTTNTDKYTLVHVVFVDIDVDNSVHHLAPVSWVRGHALWVHVVVGMCLWNRRVKRSIWEGWRSGVGGAQRGGFNKEL